MSSSPLDKPHPLKGQFNSVPYHAGRAVFILNAKCGNSAVKSALLNGEADHVHNKVEIWSPEDVAASDYIKVAITRNPYARAVSCWWQKIVGDGAHRLDKHGFREGMGWPEFVDHLCHIDGDTVDLHIRDQHKAMFSGGRWLPDVVLKLEDPDMWVKVRRIVPGLPRVLEWRNKSNSPAWFKFIAGPEAVALARRYKRDFEVLGYDDEMRSLI